MNKIFNLVLLQLKEQSPNFFKASLKKKLIYVVVALLGMSVIYFLAQEIIGLVCRTLFLVPPVRDVLSVIFAILGLIFMILFTISLLKKIYYSSDNDLYSSLPVSTAEVYISKYITIFIYELIAAVIIVLPILIAYAILIKASIGVFFLLPLIVILFTLFILAFSSLIVVPISLLLTVLKNQKIISIIFYTVALAGLFYVYIQVLSGVGSFLLIEQTTVAITKVKNGIADIATYSFFFNFFANMIYLENVLMSLGLIIAFIAGFVLVGIFSNIGSFILCGKIINDSKGKIHSSKKYAHKSKFTSILFKDVRLLIRSPGLIVQFFIFAFIMPIFVLAFNILLNSINLGFYGLQMVVGANIMIVCLLTMMCSGYCSTAISREGSSFFLLKTLPCDFKLQVYSRLLINITIVVFCSLINFLVVAATGYLGFVDAMLLFILSVVLIIGQCVMSLDNDLVNPTLDWYDTNVNSERYPSLSKTINDAMIFGGLLGLAAIVASAFTTVWFTWVLMLALTIVFTIWRLYQFKYRMYYFYKRIEL